MQLLGSSVEATRLRSDPQGQACASLEKHSTQREAGVLEPKCPCALDGVSDSVSDSAPGSARKGFPEMFRVFGGRGSSLLQRKISFWKCQNGIPRRHGKEPRTSYLDKNRPWLCHGCKLVYTYIRAGGGAPRQNMRFKEHARFKEKLKRNKRGTKEELKSN